MGMGILLNASRLRKYHSLNTDLILGEDNEVKSFLDEIIPTKFRQQAYDNDNGCVWLSTYVLVHSVDIKS